MDEKRRKVAELQSLQDELRQQIKRLDEQVVAEKKSAAEHPTEGGLSFANFAKVARERRENLVNSIAQMEQVILMAREELAEAFRELKKYETVQSNRERRDREEANRREQAVLDEIGLNMHRTRKASKLG